MNAPARIGPYEIIAEIGRGGMSVVYHGRDTRNQTEVALKVLAPIIVGRSGEAADRRAPQPDPAATGAQATPYVDQFLKEARTAGRLRHRNVVRVLEVGESQGYHYLALEYADRGTLAELLESDPRPMNPDEVVSIILQVAEALDYAHKLGYLHCDVKASNVLLTSDGRALVSDFGIARRLASGADSSPEDDPGAADDNQPIATPAYASPEQACGERNLDRRTDVYSLGVVAYYMLTGRLPFGSTDKNELLRQVVDDPPPPPESLNPRIPVAMAYALTRALAKDPRARYATTVELAQALRAGLGKAGHQAAYAPATVRPPRPRRPGLATPRLIAVMAGALAFLALGLAAVALAGPALPALSVSLPVLRPIATANPVPTQRPAKPTFTPMPTTPAVSAAAPAAVPTAARLFASATQTSNLVVQMPRVPAMQENFSIARPWWPEVKDKNSWWRVADGVYRLTIHPANTKVWLWRGVDIANFTLSFDAASMWQLPDVHVGLIFRANGTNDFHQLDCQPGKGCELSREHNTAKTVLLPRTVIPQGKLNEPARISVTANDQDIQISINDQTLASVKDPDYHRGDIALYGVSGADNEAEFSFDNYDFQPGANETTSVTLMPYQDPDGRYILNVPADWQKSTDEHAVNFDSPDRFARVYVSQVLGSTPQDTPEVVAQKYVEQARATMQEITGGPGQTRRLGDLDAFDQDLQAQVLGARVTAHLLAVNVGGRSLVIVGVAEAARELALRPLLTAVLDSFHVIGTGVPTFAPATATSAPAPQASAASTAAPPPPAAPAGQAAGSPPAPGLITGFETWGTWVRGNETWGTFDQSSEQTKSGAYVGRLHYDIPANPPDARGYVVFRQALPIAGQPNALSMWVYGDNSNCFLNVWVADSTGQQFQFTFGRIQHTGWKEMLAPLNLQLGWPNQPIDGDPKANRLVYPISLVALVLDGQPSTVGHKGVIYLDDLVGATVDAAKLTTASAQPAGSAPGTPQPAQAAPKAPTPTPVPAAPPAPAGPPSGRIAYPLWNSATNHYDIYVYRLADGSAGLFLPNARQPDFGGGGELIANGEGGGADNLVRVDSAGGNKRMVSGHVEDAHPHWSITGVSAVFDSTAGTDGRSAIFLEADPSYQHDVPPLSYGGKFLFGRYPIFLSNWRIAFAGCNYWTTGSNCGIYTTDTRAAPLAATDNPGDVPTDNRGSNIIFMAQRGTGHWDVYSISFDGSGFRRLTNGPGNNGLATASPDGNYIAFLTDREGHWSVYVMDADGSNQRKLFDLNGGFGTGDWDWTQERLSWGP